VIICATPLISVRFEVAHLQSHVVIVIRCHDACAVDSVDEPTRTVHRRSLLPPLSVYFGVGYPLTIRQTDDDQSVDAFILRNLQAINEPFCTK